MINIIFLPTKGICKYTNYVDILNLYHLFNIWVLLCFLLSNYVAFCGTIPTVVCSTKNSDYV